MKCTYHPEVDATERCSLCKKPLCNDCAIADGKNTFSCSRCVAMKAAQEVVHGTEQRLEERKEKREVQKAKRKRSPYLMIFLPISSALALLLLGLNLYFRSTIPLLEESSQPEHPVVTIMIVDQAIQDYSKDHRGEFPASLYALLGKYLPPEEITQRDLDNFKYNRTSSYSYKLEPKETGGEDISDLVFTEAGLE